MCCLFAKIIKQAPLQVCSSGGIWTDDEDSIVTGDGSDDFGPFLLIMEIASEFAWPGAVFSTRRF